MGAVHIEITSIDKTAEGLNATIDLGSRFHNSVVAIGIQTLHSNTSLLVKTENNQTFLNLATDLPPTEIEVIADTYVPDAELEAGYLKVRAHHMMPKPEINS